MTDFTALENALQDWAYTYSGNITTIWSHQNARQPVPPYITLKITSINKKGFDDLRYIDDKHYICGLRKMSLSVQAYGKNSLTILSKLKDSLEMADVELNLKAVGLGVIEAADILDTTILIDTVWEDRHSMDVFFYIANNVELPSSTTIETTKLKGTLEESQTGSQNINIDIST